MELALLFASYTFFLFSAPLKRQPLQRSSTMNSRRNRVGTITSTSRWIFKRVFYLFRYIGRPLHIVRYMCWVHSYTCILHFERGVPMLQIRINLVNTIFNALVYPLSAFSVSTNLLPLHAIKCKRIRAANIWLPNNAPPLGYLCLGLISYFPVWYHLATWSNRMLIRVIEDDFIIRVTSWWCVVWWVNTWIKIRRAKGGVRWFFHFFQSK